MRVWLPDGRFVATDVYIYELFCRIIIIICAHFEMFSVYIGICFDICATELVRFGTISVLLEVRIFMIPGLCTHKLPLIVWVPPKGIYTLVFALLGKQWFFY